MHISDRDPNNTLYPPLNLNNFQEIDLFNWPENKVKVLSESCNYAQWCNRWPLYSYCPFKNKKWVNCNDTDIEVYDDLMN